MTRTAKTHALHFHFLDSGPVFEFPTRNTNTVDLQEQVDQAELKASRINDLAFGLFTPHLPGLSVPRPSLSAYQTRSILLLLRRAITLVFLPSFLRTNISEAAAAGADGRAACKCNKRARKCAGGSGG